MTLLWYQECSIRAVTQPISCSHLAFGDKAISFGDKVISFRKESTNHVKIPMFRDLESEELESSSVPSSYLPVIYSFWVYHVFSYRRWGSRTGCSLTSLLPLLFNQRIIYLKLTLYVTSSRFWLLGGWNWSTCNLFQCLVQSVHGVHFAKHWLIDSFVLLKFL